ncbi:MAG TPA: TraR/DksA family transcriptional regulator [Mycobacteriales bacterium]|nr:TraR/DksA family transcriptional regulator [Mycobacteriales bacterium]
MNTQEIRSRLETLMRDLDRSAAALAHDRESGGEIDELVLHPADYASNVGEADREEASFEVIAAQRERVSRALERLGEGRYGQCVDCGTSMPEERLEAKPDAERCVPCQQRHEAAVRA